MPSIFAATTKYGRRTGVFPAAAFLVFTGIAGAGNSVVDWNETGVQAALAANQATSPGSATAGGASIYLTYMHLAIHNAVNAIDRRYTTYGPEIGSFQGGAVDAAVAAAAYDTLVYYLPDQVPGLNAKYAAALAVIPDGAAKTNGIAAGQAAASAIISIRAGDGRGANVSHSYPSGPVAGVWIPTPPAFLAPQTPWVGTMVPFTMMSASQFRPVEGPPALSSSEWADDFNLTKSLGRDTSLVRTSAQTEIGLFWTEQTARQYARAFRALALARDLDTVETARLFALLFTSYADAFIGCMDAKYYFSFWRPVTAVRNANLDGNSATEADANWTPLGVTPNHPEYPAAHGCVTGAVAESLKSYFGTPLVTLVVSSTVTNTAHTFTSTHDLEKEVEGARIYAGFHYHHSLVQGFVLGRRVAQQTAHDFFRPIARRE